ncbi:MAG: Holliday junction resolvase RuvX [Lachnospiraceae bacterium]|nr:Holliday junction resolvase RuvX [Lachnospiraceae bacterium]
MRVLGLDFGSKTIGVAVSDSLGMGAESLEIIRRDKESHLRASFRRIARLAEEYEITAVVLGYPLNMDGTAGDRALKTVAFKEELVRRLGLPVFLQDERLTTVEAEEAMHLSGIPAQDYKKHVDSVAAAIILEDWLNQYGDDYFHS